MTEFIKLDKHKYRIFYFACTDCPRYFEKKILRSAKGEEKVWDLKTEPTYIIRSDFNVITSNMGTKFDTTIPVDDIKKRLDDYLGPRLQDVHFHGDWYDIVVSSVYIDTTSYIPCEEKGKADFLVDFTIHMDRNVLNLLKLKGVL